MCLRCGAELVLVETQAEIAWQVSDATGFKIKELHADGEQPGRPEEPGAPQPRAPGRAVLPVSSPERYGPTKRSLRWTASILAACLLISVSLVVPGQQRVEGKGLSETKRWRG